MLFFTRLVTISDIMAGECLYIFYLSSVPNSNLQSTYKVTSFPVWYNSKISVGEKKVYSQNMVRKGC